MQTAMWPSGLAQNISDRQLPLRQRLAVERCDLLWAQNLVTENHYLHRPVDRRALPFAYAIALDKKPVGCIIMAIPHWNKQAGLFTTQEKWLKGDRHLLTNWQVLVISRLWLDPSVQHRQNNGHASNLASCAIARALKQIQRDWIEHHPPVYPELPYHCRLILSHADTGVGHEGTIYKAAGFQKWGETTNGRSRHSNQGKATGSTKLIYIHRLPEPRWSWEPIAKQLEIGHE